MVLNGCQGARGSTRSHGYNIEIQYFFLTEKSLTFFLLHEDIFLNNINQNVMIFYWKNGLGVIK